MITDGKHSEACFEVQFRRRRKIKTDPLTNRPVGCFKVCDYSVRGYELPQFTKKVRRRHADVYLMVENVTRTVMLFTVFQELTESPFSLVREPMVNCVTPLPSPSSCVGSSRWQASWGSSACPAGHSALTQWSWGPLSAVLKLPP